MVQETKSRDLLIAQYHAFASVLQDHGVPFPYLDEKEVQALTDIELSKQVHVLRDLARTPTS